VTISTEDFIKAIYIIHDHGKPALSSYVAERLGISGAAVTDMSKKLAKKGLVIHEKYRQLRLTPKGNEEALRVIRKHRIWETFLHEVLGMNMTEIHNEAELLEHQTSDNLINLLEKFLNNPQFDPHGDPIPDRNGSIPQIKGQMNLYNAKPGKYIICRIITDNDTISGHFQKSGITPGTEISVHGYLNDIDSFSVEIQGNSFLLHEKLCKKIYIINN